MSFNSFFHGFIRKLYFSRINVPGATHVPADGPLLVICLHRNGAVDGFVYRAAVPRLTYLVRKKLRRGIIGRLFFSGVEVVRRDDGGRRRDNLEMIDSCVGRLQDNRTLAVFPEGTSKLGARHLPFKSGAARIALSYVESGRPLTVLPLGIHYECPWAFRSRVEVVAGEPIQLGPSSMPESRGKRLRYIKGRFTDGLESVGVNVEDEKTFELAQKFAYIATLGTKNRYFDILKSMERGLPFAAVSAWHQLDTKIGRRRVLFHQGVPLFPPRFTWVYVTLALALTIPVLAGSILNIPPLALSYWCGRRYPDDTNVISLWRILSGVPLFILWAAAWIVVAPILGHSWVALTYVAITWVALRCWYRAKKLWVAAWNGLFHSDLRESALSLHKIVLAGLSPQKQESSPDLMKPRSRELTA